MSRIFEIVSNVLLGAFDFFESLRAKRGDDELTAEYKALQRACLFSLVYIGAVLVVAGATTSLIETLEGMTTVRMHLDGTREFVRTAFVWVFGLSFLYAVYAWLSLWRFARKHLG